MEEHKEHHNEHKESHSEHKEEHHEHRESHHTETHHEHKESHDEPKPHKEPLLQRVKDYYIKNYKKLLIIPNLILILAILQIGFQLSTTGDFLNKGVSLKGGISLTIPTDNPVDISLLEQNLLSKFSQYDITTRELASAGSNIGFTIDADINVENQDDINSFLEAIRTSTGLPLQKGEYTIESIGSSLGASFFRETFKAMIYAFIFMGIVVLLYFRKVIPALIVILAVISDIIATLAVVNLLGIKISTAGIAAFLMLIGYSVDTDMLLSTRMLKRKDLSMRNRIFSALKTGLMMSITTMVAISIALIFTQSEVIRQIMTILLIGLIFDLIFTWFQNMGVLRIYMKKKEHVDDEI